MSRKRIYAIGVNEIVDVLVVIGGSCATNASQPKEQKIDFTCL